MLKTEELRFYTVFYLDGLKKINGNRGKLAAQSQHAILHAYWDAENRFPERAKAYKHSLENGSRAKKIVLLCDNEEKLNHLLDFYANICGVTKVVDAGFTVFNEPTFTCIGIGPVSQEECEDVLKGLKVLI